MSDTGRTGDQARDDAPTDEIDLPREPNDGTRVMPVTNSDASSRTEPHRRDAPTDTAATKAYAFEQGQGQTSREQSAPTGRFERDTVQHEHNQHPRGQYQSSQYESQYRGEFEQAPLPVQQRYGGQYGYPPRPEAIRKGPSGVARLISVVINLLLSVLVLLLLWDYRGIQTMESFILNALMELPLSLSLTMFLSAFPFLIGVLLLLSGLTVAISGLGTGLFGTLLFLTGVVLTFLFDVGGSGMGQFVAVSLPLLFPTSMLMMGAGLGAHFARRAGAKRMLKATAPRY